LRSRKLKVCMVTAALGRGGAEKQLALLVRHLDRTRFDPYVLVLTRSGPYQEAIEACGVPVVVIGKKTALSPLALWRLTRLLVRLRPDVVHTWMFTSNAYGRVAARLAGLRHIIANEMCVVDWKGPVRLIVDRLLAPLTGRIVAISDSVAQSLRHTGTPPHLIETVYDGFETTGWPARELDEQRAVGSAPRLVAVGRLYAQKRYDVVIRAMALIVRNFPEAELVVAGEGPQRPALENLVAALGLGAHVRLPGVVENVPQLLAQSDLFLMGSDFEGLPSSIMEAMYVGVPVVATDVPGVRDLVANGVSGVLVPRGDHTALAAAAVSVLRDPDLRRALTAQARQKVLAEHSVERMVKAYERLYERCLSA